jgi:hypothetical protein
MQMDDIKGVRTIHKGVVAALMWVFAKNVKKMKIF